MSFYSLPCPSLITVKGWVEGCPRCCSNSGLMCIAFLEVVKKKNILGRYYVETVIHGVSITNLEVKVNC